MIDDRRPFAASWISLAALVLVLIYQVAMESLFLDYGQILALALIALAIPLGALRISRTPLRAGFLLAKAPGRAFIAAAVLALGCLPWALAFGLPFERAFIAQGFPQLPKLFEHPWVDPRRAGFAIVVLAPVALELFWRGFALGAFLGGGGRRAGRAAFLVAALGPLLFGMDPLDMAVMLPLSFGLAAVAVAGRSVLPAILGHFIWNAAGFSYNYWNLRDSLGAIWKGPSGGLAVFGLAAFALLALAAAVMLIRRPFLAAVQPGPGEGRRAADGASRRAGPKAAASGESALSAAAAGGASSGATGLGPVRSPSRAGRIVPVALFAVVALGAAVPRAVDLWFRAPPPAMSFGEAPWMRDYALRYRVLDVNGAVAGELVAELRRDGARESLAVAGSWARSAFSGAFVWNRAGMDLLSAKVTVAGAGAAAFGLDAAGGKALLPIEWAFRASALRMPEPSAPIDLPFVDLAGIAGEGPLAHIMRLNVDAPAGKFYCDRVDQYRGGAFFRSAYIGLDAPSFPVRFFDQGLEFLLESAREAR